MQRFVDEGKAGLPAPGTTPIEHARHTLAAFPNTPDGEFVVTATSGVYAESTGLTWGDLRALVKALDEE
jgi:hypothetical protein